MVKWLVIKLCLAILLFSGVAQAQSVPDFSIFVGTQEGLSFPKSFRVLWKDVELGTYSSSIGLTKAFENKNFYANFGLGISRQGNTTGGFIGGVGYHYISSFMVGFKADWSTFAAFNGYVSTEPSLGLTLNW